MTIKLTSPHIQCRADGGTVYVVEERGKRFEVLALDREEAEQIAANYDGSMQPDEDMGGMVF